MFYKIIYIFFALILAKDLNADSLGKLFYSPKERQEIQMKANQNVNSNANNLSNTNSQTINDVHKIAEPNFPSEQSSTISCNPEYRVDGIIQEEKNRFASVFLTPISNCNTEPLSKNNSMQRIEKAISKNKKYYIHRQKIEIGTIIKL